MEPVAIGDPATAGSGGGDEVQVACRVGAVQRIATGVALPNTLPVRVSPLRFS